MPRQFVPRESGRHRIACIALYRTLLTHAKNVPLPATLPSQGAINPIKHVIRKEFHRYKHHTSPRIIVEVLKRGYTAETLLRNASSTTNSPDESLKTIHTHLWTLHHQRELARQTCLAPPPRSPPPRVWALPNVPKLLDTRPIPLEDLPSARRVVPYLAIGASGVPFLRYGKGNGYLSRVMRDKGRQRQIRLDLLERLEWEGLFAGDEERWVGLLREELGMVEGGDGGLDLELEKGWVTEVKRAEEGVTRDLRRQKQRWLEMGRRMGEVVLEEREMARREREVRRGEKERLRGVKVGNVKAPKTDVSPASGFVSLVRRV